MASTDPGIPTLNIAGSVQSPAQPGSVTPQPAGGLFAPQFSTSLGTAGTTSLPVGASASGTTDPWGNTPQYLSTNTQMYAQPGFLGTAQPNAGASPTQGNTQAPAAPMSNSVGVKAPAGYEWGPTGQLQPLGTNNGAVGNAPAPSGVPIGGISPNTTVGSNAASGEPSTYQDLLQRMNDNLQNYSTLAGQSQDELNAQQGLLSSIQQQQQLKNQVLGDQLGWFGNGTPRDMAMAQYNNVGFGAQVAMLGAQNAVDISQRNLQFQQENRGVRAQVAQGLISALQGEAGLVKPVEVAPGSSLVSPQGQVAFQGTGMSPAQFSQSVASWTSTFLQQGYPLDQATALAQQQVGSLMGNGGGAGSNAGSTMQQAPMLQGNSVLGYNLSTYAPNDPQYAGKVATAISQEPIGTLGPQGIQQFISSQAPNSSITGQMVFNAAQQAGVDPRVMLGMMSVESGFGTSTIASKNNNPGNVKFVGQPNATEGSAAQDGGNFAKFLTPQDGVNAMAQELATRYQDNQQQQTSQGPSSDIIARVKSLFPVNAQNGVETMPNGIPYINLGGVPSALQAQASSIAAEHGIKSFSNDDAKGIQALSNISQALNQMTTLANGQLMPANGGIGTAGNIIKNWWGSITGTNPQLADFGIYKDSAIKSVTALAGGLGSGLRLNTGTIEAAVSNLPTQNDSLETALEKINKTRDLLAVQLGAIFGNPDISKGVMQYNGHSYLPGDMVANGNGGIGVVNQDGSITPQQ